MATAGKTGVGTANTATAMSMLGQAGKVANENVNAGGADLDKARSLNLGSTGSISPDMINKYMNPFVDMAINPVIAQLQKAANINSANMTSKAAMSGSFGNSRFGLQQSQNQADLLQQIAATSGAGYRDAYTQAMSAAENEMGRRQQGAQTSASIGAQASGQANDSVQRLLSLVAPANATAAAQSQLTNDDINRLLTTGALEQTYGQNLANANYQQFQNETNHPQTQLNALLAAAGGVPYGTTSTSNSQGTQVVQSPSMLGQIAGLGMSAAAMMSDRGAKTDFDEVDPEDVLASFRRMPVETYRYRPEVRGKIGDDGRRRVGPMSQDFGREFLGDPEAKVIPMPELIGSLVAAVKGLEARTEKLAA